MIKKSFLKNLLLVSIFLMLIQIYIGTGVREFIDDQSKLFGREDKSLWLSNATFKFYFHRSFSIIILLINALIYYISFQLKINLIYIKLIFSFIMVEILFGAVMYYFDFPILTQPAHLIIAIGIFCIQFYWLLKLR